MYRTNKDASRVLRMGENTFKDLCRQYGIETPCERRRRRQKEWLVGICLSVFLAVPLSTQAEPFVCGGPPERYYSAEKLLTSPLAARGHRNVLAVFSKFKGEAPEDSTAPPYARDLFDPTVPGSFSHFYTSMSRGALTVTGTVLDKRYESDFGPEHYAVLDPETRVGRFAEFNREILIKVDADVDFGQYDNDGPDGLPNSGDDDGYVDFLFINLRSVPTDFFVGTATGFASLGLEEDLITDDPRHPEGHIRIPGLWSAWGGATQRVRGFSHAVSSMAHEFGHVLGLPDLYDQSFLRDPELDLKDDSAGIGAWGLMGRGTLGWNGADGPNPFCAWSRMWLGWVETVRVEGEMRNVVIEDVETGGAVYRLDISDEEYFLVENRQRLGGHYDRNIPGSGLLIWHVDDGADNDEEGHKWVDLECADGLFSQDIADPISGEDGLDRWSRDREYAGLHGGNLGDATDVFDGTRFTAFAHDTNPNSNAYSGLYQNTSTGLAIRNIRRAGTTMVADFSVGEELPGLISRDTRWYGEQEISGDVVVGLGATLTLAPDTQIRFAPSDERMAGLDPDRCELIVYGDLEIEDSPKGTVTFSSRAATPRDGDWYGIRIVGSHRDVDLSRAIVRHAKYGIVRTHLPGSHIWSGEVTVSEDVIVPAGATLTIMPGTTIRFSETDAGGRGKDPERCELVVDGKLLARGSSSDAIVFTSTGVLSDSLNPWYGIRSLPGAQIDMDFCLFELSAFGITGDLRGSDSWIRISNTAFRRNASGGINLTLSDGDLTIRDTGFDLSSMVAISVSGSGDVFLEGCTIRRSLREGLVSANCGVDARSCTFLENGTKALLPPDYPSDLVAEFEERSGVRASAGASRVLRFTDCTFEGNGRGGLNLSRWKGDVEIRGGAIRGNGGSGLLVSGAHAVVLARVSIDRNGSDGVRCEGAPVECRDLAFSGNAGTGLLLTAGASGSVEGCRFLDTFGLKLADAHSVSIRGNRFENARLALLSQSAAPLIVENLFRDNEVAIRCVGEILPERVFGNSFIANDLSVQNAAAALLHAEDNYWGTADPGVIAGQIEGPVDWEPFLFVPTMDTTDGRETPFALLQNYPNPFDESTTIPFSASPSGRPIRVTIYDVLGQRVRVLAVRPGEREVVWDARDEVGRRAGCGVYFYRAAVGGLETGARRMVLLVEPEGAGR